MKNEEKKSFKELWANKQSRAIIKLVMWFSFFFIIFLFLWVASLFTRDTNSTNEDKIEEKVDVNMIALLTKLKDSEYSYTYNISINNEIYILNGTKQEKETGYYEKNNEILKYQVINEKFYKLDNNEITEETIIDEQDINNFSLNNIITEIKNFEENSNVVVTDNKYTYNISENYIIEINKNGNNINSIFITKDNNTYKLEYKTINIE